MKTNNKDAANNISTSKAAGKNPKVSIIMPTLNVKNYIGQCMKSVVRQTLEDIEIICVDAKSDDGTYEILEEFKKDDSRITLLTSDKRSYGYQVNLGLKEAAGEYIGIVETDDYIDSRMFETLYESSNNATVDIIKSNFYHVEDFGKYSKRVDTDKNKLKADENLSFTVFEHPAFLEGHPSIWAGIYKREFLEGNDIKMIEAAGGAWVDNPFFYKTTILARSIRYIDKPLYYYRVSNPDSSTNSFTDFTVPLKRILDMMDILDETGCNDILILQPFYNRLFRYIEIVLEHNNNSDKNLDYETCSLIHEVVSKLDEDIVRTKMKFNFQKLYYRYNSPLFMLRFENDVCLSDEELEIILRENNWLYSTLTDFKHEINELNYENSKLRNN